MLLPDKLFLIKNQEKKCLGITTTNQSYIIAFPKIDYAKLVIPHHKIEVNSKLKYNKLCHNVDLVIHKNIIPNSYENITEIHLEEIASYPVHYNLGIIIGVEIHTDTALQYIFNALMVDPLNDPKHFQPYKAVTK